MAEFVMEKFPAQERQALQRELERVKRQRDKLRAAGERYMTFADGAVWDQKLVDDIRRQMRESLQECQP